jgi:DNA-binding MarR family transcriptional regulator
VLRQHRCGGMRAMLEAERTALDLWRQVTTRTIANPGPDLTARQSAILLTVHLDPGPHTVRGLSAALSIGKPAVVRALDLLQASNLISRAQDPADRRSVLISPTQAGAALLADMAGGLASALATITAAKRDDGDDETGRAVA